MKNSPRQAPYPAAEFVALSLKERAACMSQDVSNSRPGITCETALRISVFFDGTNNNRFRDQPHGSHSNIAKLFAAHKADKYLDGIFSIYVPGVGTRFPEIGELREEPMGKAAGKGGQARILFGLLQVYNAIHRAAYRNRPMYDGDEIKALLRQYVREAVYGDGPDDEGRRRVVSRQQWFGDLGEKLGRKLDAALARKLPRMSKLVVSVFGFSRGAAQARAFCHWFADAAAGGFLAGIPASIRFVGLFDTVASVGLADSARLTTPLWFADGHFDWASEVPGPLPSMVEKVVHYVAAHEQRMNFPVTLVRGGGKVEEVIFPGVHSDVGGGYGPGAQGRSPAPADLLSQIPLLHMYRAALVAGVPMRHFADIENDPDTKADFQISARLATAWNNYMQLAGFTADGEAVTEGGYDALVRLHMGPYYRMRGLLVRSDSYEREPTFLEASAQDQQDLSSYNKLLRGDLILLVLRRQMAQGQGRTGDPSFGQTGNQFPMLLLRSGQPLSEWEEWARECANGSPFAPGQRELMASYVHDSLAGFYLAFPTTAADKAALVRQVQAKQATGQALNPPELRIAEAMTRNPALAKEISQGNDNEDLSPASRNRLDAVFPVLTDADAPYLRQAAIRTQTSTAREGGGYLRARMAH